MISSIRRKQAICKRTQNQSKWQWHCIWLPNHHHVHIQNKKRTCTFPRRSSPKSEHIRQSTIWWPPWSCDYWRCGEAATVDGGRFGTSGVARDWGRRRMRWSRGSGKVGEKKGKKYSALHVFSCIDTPSYL